MTKYDEAAASRLTANLMAVIRAHYLARTTDRAPQPSHVYEVLSALAAVTSVTLEGTSFDPDALDFLSACSTLIWPEL